MITKICKKCKNGFPEDTGFYANDSSCKECRKAKVRANRAAKIEYYREYDRARGNRQGPDYCKVYRNKYPNKYRAHTLVNNCIRDGKLVKKPCEVCGSVDQIHAHHDDYLEPLNIRWLCAAHHHQWHAKNGEAANP